MQDESNRGAERQRRGGITIVVPLFNERESIQLIWDGLASIFEDWAGLPDVIFVDDGSTDGSAAALDQLASQQGENVTAIHLRGNFGKSAALAAGFAQARGDLIVTMDADLQDDPAEIPRLLDAVDSGFDVVCGYKKKRNDPWRRVVASRVFNWLVRLATGTRLHDVNSGFKALRREVVEELTLYGELHRFIPVLASWRGFRVGEIVVRHRPRRFGKSKFGAARYFRGFVDLLTVSFLTRYERRPAHFFAAAGALTSSAGFLICSYLTALWVMGVRPIGDRPLLLLGVLLLVVGFQGVGLGMLAELITKGQSAPARPYAIAKIVVGGSLGEPDREAVAPGPRAER